MTAAARSPSRSTRRGSPPSGQDMTAAGLAAVCVTGPEDIYYLTGLNHQGHFAFTMLVLPATGVPVIVARQMEATTLSVQVPWCLHHPFRDHEDPAAAVLAAIEAVLPAPTAVRFGVDKAGMWLPIGIWERVTAGLPQVTWQDTSDAGRPTSSGEERRRRWTAYGEAAAISSAAMRAGIDAVRVGVNARDIAAAVYTHDDRPRQ